MRQVRDGAAARARNFAGARATATTRQESTHRSGRCRIPWVGAGRFSLTGPLGLGGGGVQQQHDLATLRDEVWVGDRGVGDERGTEFSQCSCKVGLGNCDS